MASCARCGGEVRPLSVGESSELCTRCQAAKPASQTQIAPRRAAPYRPPATTALLVVNTLVFLAMAAAARSLQAPSNSLLLQWGANWGPLSLDGQPWRILTANYVHIGILHIAFNMWALWQLGRLAERIFGSWTYLLIYTACGIAASIVSLFWHPLVIGAGASGAIFGLVGALISVLYLGKLPFPKTALRATLKSLLIVVVVNLLLGATARGIDNSAHMGGLVMGLGLGAALAPSLTALPPRRRLYEGLIFGVAMFLLLAAGSFVQRRKGYVVFANRASRTMNRSQRDEVISELQRAAAQDPRNKTILALLGDAYLENKNYASAETTCKGLLALDPGDLTAQYHLGLVYGATRRYEEARQIFSQLAQRRPKDDDVWLLLGSSLDGLGRQEEAARAFQRAIASNAQNPEAYRELGLAQLKLQQRGAAIASLEKAMQLDPTSAPTLRELAQAYLEAGRHEEAAAALEQAAELARSQENQAAKKP